MSAIQPFEVKIPEEALADLKARLKSARWITDGFGADWAYGAPLPFVKALCEHWQSRFDWRALETRINQLSNITTEIEGVPIHAVHRRSRSPDALPLLLIHGWPGSFLEFLDLVTPLAEPPTGEPAFHAIAPSLPGYGFSGIPARPGLNPRAIAGILVELMERLGYPRFIVQGGDWGSLVASEIARHYPARCIGLHLNMVGGSPPPPHANAAELSREEQQWVADFKQFKNKGSGYYAVQSTRPATPAHALNDSPAGLAAWIGEKFYYWSDRLGTDVLQIPFERLIGNIALYWLTGTIGSSMRLYYEHTHRPSEPHYVAVPTAGAIFPKELIKLPRAWAEKLYNIVQWNVFDRGGHFAAMEVPDLLLADIRRFAKTLALQGDIKA